MSLRLTKPGVDAVAELPVHHFTGLRAIGILPSGKVVWPAMGGSEDEDDEKFTGGGGGGGGSEDDDDEEDEDEDDESEEEDKKPKKGKHSKDDDDEDEAKLTRPERQAARYRTQLRAAEKRNADLEARLKAIEDKDKKPEELASRDLTEARERAEKASARVRQLNLENAFFRANAVDWVDPADALRLLDLDDVEIDEDGTVDARSLRTALRDLAKRKPHLVKSKTASDNTDEDDTDSRSGSKMNGRRKGKGAEPTRAELAKRFPVLNQSR